MRDDRAKSPGPPEMVELVIPADAVSVRAALVNLFDTLLLRRLSDDRRGAAELVLAEVLNNIVEHAYAAQSGQILLRLHVGPRELHCHVEDSGTPMPRGELPCGALKILDSHGEPAEGGFGWHLIRALSRDLDYRRIDGRNQLSFRLETD